MKTTAIQLAIGLIVSVGIISAVQSCRRTNAAEPFGIGLPKATPITSEQAEAIPYPNDATIQHVTITDEQLDAMIQIRLYDNHVNRFRLTYTEDGVVVEGNYNGVEVAYPKFITSAKQGGPCPPNCY